MVKSDVQNAFRKVTLRLKGKQSADYENFTEILREMFFVMETEQLIDVVEKDIQNIDRKAPGATSEKI